MGTNRDGDSLPLAFTLNGMLRRVFEIELIVHRKQGGEEHVRGNTENAKGCSRIN